VTVAGQPSNPTQTCAVTNGSGAVGNANITNIEVACTTKAFSVLGSVSGLSGSGLVLQNNGVDNFAVPLPGNGPFAFAAMVLSGGTYNVTVAAQPTNPTQNCTVTNGAGTVGGADITNVAVSCVTVATPPTAFFISGSVAGLAGSGLLLRNNGVNDNAIGGNGPFIFSSALPNGGHYNVTVANQPSNPLQSCTVTNGSGTVAGANVSNVTVNCVSVCPPGGCTVGGSIAGLTTSGLVLANGGDTVSPVTGATAFTLPTPLAEGGTYAVAVKTQPAGQTCAVSNAAGTVGTANVVSILVSCRGYAAFSPDFGGEVWQFRVAADGTLFAPNPVAVSVPTLEHVSPVGTASMAVTSDGLYAYAGNRLDNSIMQYSVDAQGQLHFNGGTVISTSPLILFFAPLGASAPFGLAISPDNRYLYATDNANGAISQFAIGPTGVLTPLSPASVSIGSHPWQIAVSPNGRHVYAVNAGSNTVSQLSVGSDGTLTPLSPASVATENGPTVLALSPDGKYAYVAYQSGNVVSQFSIDPGGALTPLSPATVAAGNSSRSIAVSVDSKYVYVSNAADGTLSQYSIGVGGALMPLVPATVSTAITRLGDPIVTSNPNGIGLTPDGLFLYVANNGRSAIAQFSIGAGGALTPLVPLESSAGTFANGVVVR
jgi:6-phosphogluconolactonase (cycloisomerase 2 family)